MIISAPLGPVGVLCLRETLHNGRREGLITGVGAMLSDVFYGILVYIGVGLIIDFIIQYDAPIRIIGGVIILAFSYYLARTGVKFKDKPTNRLSKMHGLRKVLTAFVVTLTNPFIMLLILPLYTRFQFVRPTAYPEWELLVAMLSIGAGCMIWWSLLTYWVRRLASSAGARGLRYISYGVATVLGIIGIIGIVTGADAMITGRDTSQKLRQLNETYFSAQEQTILEE